MKPWNKNPQFLAVALGCCHQCFFIARHVVLLLITFQNINIFLLHLLKYLSHIYEIWVIFDLLSSIKSDFLLYSTVLYGPPCVVPPCPLQQWRSLYLPEILPIFFQSYSLQILVHVCVHVPVLMVCCI